MDLIPYRSILVGVDFTPGSRQALAVAADVAQRSGADLHIRHFIHAEIAEEHRRHWQEGIDQLLGLAQCQLDDFVEATLGPTWSGASPLEPKVQMGHRFVDLMQSVREVDAELLVLGAHSAMHDRSQSPSLLGEKCVRKAPCEVMLVGDEPALPFRNLLVAIDFSENAARALDEALELAQLTGARVHVVNASLPPWLFLTAQGLADVKVSERVRREHRQRLEEAMEAFLSRADNGVEVGISVLESQDPVAGVLECAEQTDADLIVLGRRGKTPSTEMMLGHFAERVVRGAKRAILVVPPGANARRAKQERKEGAA